MHENKKAVALRYDEELPAPLVIAKGKGELAKKIVELAAEYNVPWYKEQEALLDSLFTLDIGTMIPEELFEVVAVILSYTYMLQERR